MKTVLNIIGNYFLNLLALSLLNIVHVLDIFFQIIARRKQKATLIATSKAQKKSAYALDVFGATNYIDFFNITCVAKGGIKFGKVPNKSISWYLQANKESKTLTFFGIVLYYAILIADFTTWVSGGHYKFYEK